MEKIKRTFDYLFIFLFFLAMGAPGVSLFFVDMGKEPNYENRRKKSLPVIRFNDINHRYSDLKEFPGKFGAYFNDNFVFRETLISLYADMKTGLFNTNPFPSQVVKGSGDWLFLGEYNSDEIRESKGFLLFTDDELKRLVNHVLQIKHTLDSLNIRFYLAIAPNKTTVYGQFLPILHTGGPTKLDQVKAALLSNGIDLIDLKKGFEKYPPGVLFYKTDSHWNDHGIFLGYRNLMQRMKRDGFSNLKIHKVTQYWQRVSSQIVVELARVLRQPSIENKLIFIPKQKAKVKVLESGVKKKNSGNSRGYSEFYRYKSNSNSLKILFFHDSFFLGIHQFVNDGFGETVLTRSMFSTKTVIDEKPDIVVYEIVERHLDVLLFKVQ
jgi:hypothetical protein